MSDPVVLKEDVVFIDNQQKYFLRRLLNTGT